MDWWSKSIASPQNMLKRAILLSFGNLEGNNVQSQVDLYNHDGLGSTQYFVIHLVM